MVITITIDTAKKNDDIENAISILKALMGKEKDDNPFKERESIPTTQVDEIANLNDPPYIRRVTENNVNNKSLHLFRRNSKISENEDFYKCVNILANECKAGGLNIVGKAYADGYDVKVCLEDFEGHFRTASFSRMVNGVKLTSTQVDEKIRNRMKELEILDKHHLDYDLSKRHQRKLPRD